MQGGGVGDWWSKMQGGGVGDWWSKMPRGGEGLKVVLYSPVQPLIYFFYKLTQPSLNRLI